MRASRRPRGLLLRSTIVAVAALTLSACSAQPTATPTSAASAEIIHVPADQPTIAAAAAAVAEGGMILVAPGTYNEQVLIDTPDVTIRGEERNTTIIDGESLRPYGIVGIADGVRIENLTVRNTTFYGVLVTGMHDEDGPTAHGGSGYSNLDPEKFPPLQRFAIDHVTAYNNGLYGIYAFDSNNGVISNSYASGSADSGFYVGQCRDCNILVTGNVAERNAIGFENANASDSLYLVGNRFSGNRVGMTLISNYQEAFTPQHGNTVVGNLISGNTSADSPAQADGGFGIGIGISGGQDNVVSNNRIEGNPRAGILLANTEDLPATGNQLMDNVYANNGIDLANVSAARSPAVGNCIATTGPTLLPAGWLAACPASGDAQPAAARTDLPPVAAPAGLSFLAVTPPSPQPSLTDITARPSRLPAKIAVPDLGSIATPSADFLIDLINP
jgi:hypothetical protein